MFSQAPRIVLLVVLTALSLLSNIQAQDTAVLDSLFVPDTTVVAIPINEIGSKAVDASTTLWSIRQDTRPSGLAASISQQMKDRQPAIEQLREETDLSLERDTDQDWLLELDRRWGRTETSFAEGLNSLSGESKSLSDDLLKLASMERRWKLTRDAATKIEAPASLLANVDSVLFEIYELTPLVQERLNDLLEVQSQLSSERQIIRRTRDRLTAKASDQLEGYVRRESIPVFDILSLGKTEGRPQDDRSYAVLYYDSLRSYFSTAYDYIWLQLGLLILLTWLTVTLRRRIAGWNTVEPSVEVDVEIFSRPYSAALLVTLLSTELIYPQASVFLVGIALVLSIWPAYRVLEIMTPQELKRALQVFFSFLVVILIAQFLIPEHYLIGRLTHFLFTVVAIALLGLLLRKPTVESFLQSSKEGRVILTILRLAFILLTTALAAGLVGFGPLARHLTTATVHSAYFVLLILVGSMVVRAIVLGFLKSPTARRSSVIKNHYRSIASRFSRYLSFFAVLLAMFSVVETFGVYQVVYSVLADALTSSIRVGEAEISFGGVILFLGTFWIALLLARFIRLLLEEEFLSRVQMSRGKPQAISGTVYYVLITLGLIFALSATGMPMDRLTVLAGAFGVGLGFGLQDVVNNFVSGLILLYESPIQVGDTIEFGTKTGTVRRIGIRSSVVRTFEGAEVNVPNSHLVSNDVTNWTMSDTKRRLTVPFGVAYGTDTSGLPELLLAIARENARVDRYPDPMVLFTAMGDSSLNFELRCWTSSSDWVQVRSELVDGVYSALGEAGIEIPFPQRDLHVKSFNPDIGNLARPASGGQDGEGNEPNT